MHTQLKKPPVRQRQEHEPQRPTNIQQKYVDQRPEAQRMIQLKQLAATRARPEDQKMAQLKALADTHTHAQRFPIQRNDTGIPDGLKTMYEQVEKPKKNKSKGIVNSVAQKKSNVKQGVGFVDNRPEPMMLRQLRNVVAESPKIQQLDGAYSEKNYNTKLKQHRAFQNEKNMIQGKFYYGSASLQKAKLVEQLGNVLKPYINNKGKIMSLADHLWKEFGDKNPPDMEMGTVVKGVKKNNNMENGWIKRVVKDLKSVAERDVNTPKSFIDRISNDVRLNDKMKDEYIKAFNDRMNNPGRHDKAKVQVKNMRAEWVKKNIGEADKELKTGDYFSKKQKKNDFRDIEIESKLSDDAEKIMSKVEKRVLGMKDSLVAAWYYNIKNENDIFKDHALRSYTERSRIAGKKVDSKSMSEDIKVNKTGGYFYSFIEHQDSPFNKNTRFTQEATSDGVLGNKSVEGDGRRVRIPLRKMTKAGAIIMGGDLFDDRQETEKMNLSQNATPNKLFGSRGEDDKLQGLLRNYVKFVGRRIYEAQPYAIWKLNPLRSYTEGEKVLQKLKKDLDSMTDAQLWEYLVRQIAQPQLMTPLKVATSIKGFRKDKP